LKNDTTIIKSEPIAPWYGFDLDGTLAKYDGYKGHTHIGEPIPAVVELVFKYIAEGKIVKIFTARASEQDPKRRLEILEAIARWSWDVFDVSLPVTCIKDYGMVLLFDDRCKQVIPNTGVLMESLVDKLTLKLVNGGE
jgi:hypothetical protein